MAVRRYLASRCLTINGRTTSPTVESSKSSRRTGGSASPSSAAASASRRRPSPSACSGSSATGRSPATTPRVDPRALGYSLTAVIRIRPAPRQIPKVAELARDTPEVVECHRITGEDCFFMKAHGARRRAPRGAHRPLRRVRPDDDLDRPVVARSRGAACTSACHARGVPLASLGDSFSAFFDAVGDFFDSLAAIQWLSLLLRADRVRDLPDDPGPGLVQHPARGVSRRADRVPVHLGRVHRRLRVQRGRAGPRRRRHPPVPDQVAGPELELPGGGVELRGRADLRPLHGDPDHGLRVHARARSRSRRTSPSCRRSTWRSSRRTRASRCSC